ncbi:MAG: phosphoadenylyl-sulfate reductase [Pseudomonadota bacterium]
MPLDATPVRPPVLERALSDPLLGKVALVSSFGADAVVLLHMVSELDPNLPVLMIDTEMLFDQTLDYQREVSAKLGLTNVQIFRAPRAELLIQDADSILHVYDPDACCALRKTEPLQKALAPYNTWITGRRRDQTPERAKVKPVELDAFGRVKLSPLVDWSAQDVSDYIQAHQLPRHPLVKDGYLSIGCAPCTTPVSDKEDPRAGRWRGRAKTECGIHLKPKGHSSGAAREMASERQL